MRRRFRAFAGAVVGLVLLLLAGCAGTPAPKSAGSGGASGEPIVIGSVWPLTGTSAAVAKDGMHGVELAVELINAQGGLLGRPVKAIFLDDKNDAKAGVASIEKLVVEDKAFAIVGGVGSGLTQAYIGALQKYSPPPLFITTGASARTIEDRYGNLDWAFYVHPWDYHYQEALHEFLLGLDPKPKSIAIAHEDGAYGTSHTEMAVELYKKSGIEVVMREKFKTGTTDLSGIISKAKSLNPDVLYWIGYGADQVLFTRQTKELDFNPKLFITTVQAGTEEYHTAVGKDGDYVTFIGGWVPGVEFPASQTNPELFLSTKEFLEKFKAKYGTEAPHYYAPMSFSATMALAAGIKKAGAVDQAKVIEAMRTIDTSTPMGPLKISPSQKTKNHFYKTMMVLQWQDGKRVVVWPKEAAVAPVRYPMPPWSGR